MNKTLFDIPIAANCDPVTSYKAAEKVNLESQCAEVLAALKNHNKVCSKELSDLSGLNRHLCARRLPNLRDMGQVQNCPHPCGEVACKQGKNNDSCPLVVFKTYKGRSQIVWYLRPV